MRPGAAAMLFVFDQGVSPVDERSETGLRSDQPAVLHRGFDEAREERVRLEGA